MKRPIISRDGMKEGEVGEEAKIIYQQENEFSENLKRIHRRDRIAYPVIGFFIGLIVVTLNIYFRNITTAWKLLLYYAIVLILPVMGYFEFRYIDGTYPKLVYCSDAGIRWVTRRNKEVFIPWSEVIKVSPVGHYGAIMGFGKRKVSDYGLFFKKPFPGYTFVSEEVGKKIEEYLREFREKSSNSLNGGRNKYV